MIRGVYTNNPHTLMRFDVAAPRSSAQRRRLYTLVVSQHEKTHNIDFTLNVYCTSTFQLYHTPPPPHMVSEVRGAWDASNAGGCLGKPG